MARSALLLLAAFLLLSPVAAPVVGRAQDTPVVPTSHEQMLLSFAPLVRDAAPAVVNIYTTQTITQSAASPLFDDPFFQRFFGGMPGAPLRQRQQNALGSGVIVRPDGLVVTNHHVVAGADSIRVVLSDRSEYEADVVLSDERTDLALVRLRDIGGRTLPVLPLGDSDHLAVGDLVLAIGNPFGVGQTVTSGIVSALARTSVGITDYDFFIQTDAAINPGNSGGALIGMDGSLIGINSAIYSRSGGSMGIGFAIPVDMLKSLLAAVDSGGPVVHPWLGADGQAIDATLAEAYGLDHPSGVLINTVDPRGPAAAGGLAVGDVVLAVNGLPVDDPDALRYRVATATLGDAVTMSILRDGAAQDLTIAIEAPPEDPPRDMRVIDGTSPFAGATVANLSPALSDELNLHGRVNGVIVLDVARRSAAERIGLKPHDILLRLDEVALGSVADLEAQLDQGKRRWHVAVDRDGDVLEADVGG